MAYPFFMDTPTIETDRMILRKIGPRDEEDIFAYASDRETTEYVIWNTHQTIADSRAYIQFTLDRYAKDEAADWGMVLKASGRLIGTISLFAKDFISRRAEMGFVIGRPYWGQGLTPEAGASLLKLAFEEMQLHRVECRHFAPNKKSGRVMQKLNMTYEGTAREAIQCRGIFWDICHYGILRSEWEAGKQ